MSRAACERDNLGPRGRDARSSYHVRIQEAPSTTEASSTPSWTAATWIRSWWTRGSRRWF